jgi:hypothetical protein
VFWFMTGRKRTATLLACCVTVFGILMFGIFGFRTFRHGSIDAGIRWAAFAMLLAVFTTSKVKEELRTEHLEHQPGPVNDG